MSIEDLEDYLNKVSDRLNEDTRFKYIHIRMSGKEDMVGVCCEVCDLKSNLNRSTLVERLVLLNESKLDKWLKYTIDSIIAVNSLNEFMNTYQEKSDNNLKVVYKWGNNEKTCKILDWSSNRVVIRLSKKALKNLIIYLDEFKNEISISGYSDNVCEFVSKFNGEGYNKILEAELSSSDIMQELSKYVISTVDVINNIINDKDNTNRTIKSIFKIDELDIVCNIAWKINKNTSLDIEVDVDKIVDTQSSKVVRNEKLYKSVKGLLEYKIQVIQEAITRRE